MIEILHDISEQVFEEEKRREFEEKMKEAQRLESLGVMAGGIAHDFNNLLTPILGEASLSLLELPSSAPTRVRLERIQKAGHRAASLTRQMLDYAGQESGTREILDLSKLVSETGGLVEGAVSGRAVVTYDLAEEPLAIEADPARLSQLVMNLITNATEALKPGDGHIEICTGRVESEKLDRRLLLGDELTEAGSYVYLEITDNGCGMDDATRSKIFDPFFTTKFTGRGLGLSATLGVVRSHGGGIELETDVERGTRFRVLFPATSQIPGAIVKPADRLKDWTASGTVLVVDDDAAVRDLVGETLRRAKLKVLMASDGLEAIELFRSHADEIRAVVLDRTMPVVDGAEAVGEFRRIRPDTPIILVSGYFEERAVWDFLDEKLDFFLHKPFEPMDLIAKIKHILEEQ